MKSLLFILLAGYAVRSDENNYYVVQVLDDPPNQFKKPFKVYWNVPTMQCASKKIYFDKLYEKFGIIQNDNDRFKGEKVTILYDPGLFPALFKNETSGKFRFRNGGVPQEGDLNKHLEEFKKELDSSIPDKNFDGLGIIDFESWRPVFRQNFGVLVPYKDVSYEIERSLHWWWKKAWIDAEAKRRFEEAARTFMQTTLSVAKQLRPRALWGFYGFPYCFNMASNNMVESCATNVPQENDRIPWLWSESTALYPSIYSGASLSTSQLVSLIRGRVREAARNAKGDVILPYFWFRYRDAGYLSENDLNVALATLYKSNASGTIIWGSSNDVNTVAKCNKLFKYVENVFGPAIAKYTKPPNRNNDENHINKTMLSLNDVSTDSPIFNDSTRYTSTNLDQDPEFHWTPPENYTQNIKTYVEEEIQKKFRQNVTAADNQDTVLENSSILIDLILNTVLNNVNNTYNSSDTSKNEKNKNSPLEDVSLVNSTKEINVKSTYTSQIPSSVVTNSPVTDEIDDTNPQVDSNIINIRSTVSSKCCETTTTGKIDIKTANNINKSSFKSQLGILDVVSEITTTDNSNFNEMTDSYYDPKLDSVYDYFFNLDTFAKEYPTTISNHDVDATATDSETKITKSDIKEFSKAVTEEYLLKTSNVVITTDLKDINIETTDKNDISEILPLQFTDIYLTTENFNENTKNTRKKVEEVTESLIVSTESETTKYIDFNETGTKTTRKYVDITESSHSLETTNNIDFIKIYTSTKKYDDITESSHLSETTKYIKFMKTITSTEKKYDNTESSHSSETTKGTTEISISLNTTINNENNIEPFETSTKNNEHIAQSAIESEKLNSYIVTTTDLTNSQEVSRTVETFSDVKRTEYMAEESDAMGTKIPEETASIVPTSTDQVVKVNY